MEGNNVKESVKAITCDIYIDEYLPEISSDQRKLLKREYYGKPENYLCPDTPSFEI